MIRFQMNSLGGIDKYNSLSGDIDIKFERKLKENSLTLKNN